MFIVWSSFGGVSLLFRTIEDTSTHLVLFVPAPRPSPRGGVVRRPVGRTVGTYIVSTVRPPSRRRCDSSWVGSPSSASFFRPSGDGDCSRGQIYIVSTVRPPSRRRCDSSWVGGPSSASFFRPSGDGDCSRGQIYIVSTVRPPSRRRCDSSWVGGPSRFDLSLQ